MKKILIVSATTVIGGAALLYWQLTRHIDTSPRSPNVAEFIRNPSAHADWLVKAGSRCGSAPFAFPTTGFIGHLWGDTFDSSHPHQGIDIFGGTEPGVTPVYAAAPGYLSRLPAWKSAVIVRIPSDPLQPGRQIWTYYTHMAGPDGNSFISTAFPQGANEVFVEAGTLLGHMGNFSGKPGQPVGVQLHFSIVQDDGHGGARNELLIQNTLDPSPYLRLNLKAETASTEILVCQH